MDEQGRLRLLAFFEARLDEEESAAKAATSGPWRHNPDKHWRKPGTAWFEEAVFAGPPGEDATCVAGTGETNDAQSMADAAFIARHHPTRALVEIHVKRTLVKLYRLSVQHRQDSVAGAYLDAIKLHTTAHADHPDFDLRWGQ